MVYTANPQKCPCQVYVAIQPRGPQVAGQSRLCTRIVDCKIDFGFMVVMDWIDVAHIRGQLSEQDLARVREAKELLHKHDYVCGDLRRNNILKPKDGSGVMLIDFDWCGKEGEGRYPLSINGDESCGWYCDVGPGVLMFKVHDDHLFNGLSQNE